MKNWIRMKILIIILSLNYHPTVRATPPVTQSMIVIIIIIIITIKIKNKKKKETVIKIVMKYLKCFSFGQLIERICKLKLPNLKIKKKMI